MKNTTTENNLQRPEIEQYALKTLIFKCFKEKGSRLSIKSTTSWSEWGDSNARSLEPKSSAIPPSLHPDI